MVEAKISGDRLRLAVLVGLLVVVAVVGVWYWGGGSLGGESRSTGEIDYVARSLPPLEIEEAAPEDVEAAGSVANPFAFRAPPTPTKNLTPPPTRIPRPTMPPRPRPTPRRAVGLDGNPKPPPPPFDREFIGYLGPASKPVAVFRRGGNDPLTSEIEVATVGDVINGVYIVREIGIESVLIGFVGYARSEDTRVPLSEK